MKNLVDILLEKLDIDDVKIGNSKYFVKDFPLDNTIEKIVNYLKDNDFKEVSWPTMKELSEFKKDLEKENWKVFTMYGNEMIRFANTTYDTISKDNPIFVIYKGKSANHLYFESNKWWERRDIKPDDFLAKMKYVFNN